MLANDNNKLFTTGEESCAVHLVNDGVIVDDRDVSVYFIGTGPVESYFCKMDESPFVSCKHMHSR